GHAGNGGREEVAHGGAWRLKWSGTAGSVHRRWRWRWAGVGSGRGVATFDDDIFDDTTTIAPEGGGGAVFGRLEAAQIYDAAMGMGHAKHDTAAVFDVQERMSSPAAPTETRSGAKRKART
ncbi:MAG: hypothetical protein Q8R98_13770, partial [Rubrivivax sp.]|nr:hypothetical protein [Rubrivivax sp.]